MFEKQPTHGTDFGNYHTADSAAQPQMQPRHRQLWVVFDCSCAGGNGTLLAHGRSRSKSTHSKLPRCRVEIAVLVVGRVVIHGTRSMGFWCGVNPLQSATAPPAFHTNLRHAHELLQLPTCHFKTQRQRAVRPGHRPPWPRCRVRSALRFALAVVGVAYSFNLTAVWTPHVAI